MTELFAFTVLSALVMFLGYFVLWGERAFAAKVTAVALVFWAVLAIGLFLADTLGRPKLVSTSYPGLAEADVLGSRVTPQWIYLFVVPSGGQLPESLKLPFSEALAASLKQAQEDAEQNQNGLRFRTERSFDNEPKFYAPAQPALPEKPVNNPPAWVDPGI